MDKHNDKYDSIRNHFDDRTKFQQFLDRLPKWMVHTASVMGVIMAATVITYAVVLTWKPAKSYTDAMLYNIVEFAKPEAVDSMRSTITTDSLNIIYLNDSVNQLGNDVEQLSNYVYELESTIVAKNEEIASLRRHAIILENELERRNEIDSNRAIIEWDN